MKTGFAIALGILLAWSPGMAFAHSDDHSVTKSLVRIQLNNDKSVEKTVAEMGLDVAGIDLHERTIDVVADQEALETLKTLEHIQIIESFETTTLPAPDQQYFNSQEVAAALQKFHADYPQLTALKSIGKTVEGKDIWAIKISDNPNEREPDEPAILFNAMHHAREVMTTEVAIDTIEHLLTRYEVDFAVADWVNNTEIWVVPMLNVDGNDKVWRSDTMWRKNTKNGHGVDLNRNYPYAWNKCNGSSGSRNSDTYRGEAPASEPETQALMNLVSEIEPVFDISYHSYSELVIYPYGCDGERAGNREIVEGIGKELARMLPSDRGGGRTYTAGTSWETLYSVDGSDIDWMHNEHDVIPYVIELNANSQGFQPSYNPWRERTTEKARAAWQFLLNRVQQSGIRGVVDGATAGGVVQVSSANTSATKPFNATYKLKKDGSFHIVLEPGMYNVSIAIPGRAAIESQVTVGASRVDLEF